MWLQEYAPTAAGPNSDWVYRRFVVTEGPEMRALLTTQPGYGHLNPLLPYAFALRDAGHEVRIASSGEFADAITRNGFACEPVGGDFTWDNVAHYFPYIAEAGRAGRHHEVHDLTTVEIPWTKWHPVAARDLLALFERWRPDVVIREGAEEGATLACEAAGVPLVCASWGALPGDDVRWRQALDWDRLLDYYAEAWHDLGLAPGDHEQAWKRQRTFTALPPAWFGAVAPDVDVRHFRVPPVEGSAVDAPDWLDAMGRDRPLVYTTLGTVFNKMSRLRGAILEALADVDADVLMTVGRDVDPAQLEGVPSNVRVESFVAQSLVLPRASLVVGHAGLGTILGAIYHGVPMVIVAIGGDQPINARRAEELGIARAFDVPGAKAAPLRDAVRAALSDSAMRKAVDALRAECDAMAPLSEAVTALEHVAASA